MTYRQSELLEAHLRLAAAQCIIDAIKLEEQTDALTKQSFDLREQARLLNDAASECWALPVDDNEED